MTELPRKVIRIRNGLLALLLSALLCFAGCSGSETSSKHHAEGPRHSASSSAYSQSSGKSSSDTSSSQSSAESSSKGTSAGKPNSSSKSGSSSTSSPSSDKPKSSDNSKSSSSSNASSSKASSSKASSSPAKSSSKASPSKSSNATSNTASEIPESLGSDWEKQSGGLYYTNSAKPDFSAYKKNKGEAFENYSDLDELGRCGEAVACIGLEIMPTEGRGDISEVRPSGWRQAQYDFINGGHLYNRCHLIAFSLAGENANWNNLITGTRQMNETMILFENIVYTYVTGSGNHVLYRVTPVFEDNELVARGVHMEALSVEDNGARVNFNAYIPNKQDGVTIDYSTGDNSLAKSGKSNDSIISNDSDGSSQDTSGMLKKPVTSSESDLDNNSDTGKSASSQSYVLNMRSKKFHYPSCSAVSMMSESNKATSDDSRDELISQGYSSCGICHP